MKRCLRIITAVGLLAGFCLGVMFVTKPNIIKAEESAVLRGGTPPPSVLEKIGRSLVAVRRSTNEVYIGWRLLGTDSPDVAFNLYRSANGGSAVKINSEPITATTDFLDATADVSLSTAYFVRPVLNGAEQEVSNKFTLPANAAVQQYLNVPLQRPAAEPLRSRERLSGKVLIPTTPTMRARLTWTVTVYMKSS